jgi:hypothetical protein
MINRTPSGKQINRGIRGENTNDVTANFFILDQSQNTIINIKNQ